MYTCMNVCISPAPVSTRPFGLRMALFVSANAPSMYRPAKSDVGIPRHSQCCRRPLCSTVFRLPAGSKRKTLTICMSCTRAQVLPRVCRNKCICSISVLFSFLLTIRTPQHLLVLAVYRRTFISKVLFPLHLSARYMEPTHTLVSCSCAHSARSKVFFGASCWQCRSL